MANATTVSAPTHPSFVINLTSPPQRAAPYDDTSIVLGNLRVNVEGFTAVVDDEPVTLTTQEFAMLAALAQRAGRLVTQEALAMALWPEPKAGYGKHLGVVMSRVRAKLAGSFPYRIETVRNRGFVLKSARF